MISGTLMAIETYLNLGLVFSQFTVLNEKTSRRVHVVREEARMEATTRPDHFCGWKCRPGLVACAPVVRLACVSWLDCSPNGHIGSPVFLSPQLEWVIVTWLLPFWLAGQPLQNGDPANTFGLQGHTAPKP